MNYLRRLRLQIGPCGARGQLREHSDSDCGRGPLGIPALSRFAEQYSQMFGESPSETLRAATRVNAEPPS
jgi:hypothetical protein